jgi:hypothetical protein
MGTRETIWVIDSDLCDRCDALLDDFGICPNCGWDGVDWDTCEEDDYYGVDED